jgi:hypothetical protein
MVDKRNVKVIINSHTQVKELWFEPRHDLFLQIYTFFCYYDISTKFPPTFFL